MRLCCFFLLLLLSGCSSDTEFTTPTPDPGNGGLILPDGFGALIVADTVGPTRHIAVNDNGDIYAKLRIATGTLGNVALRDTTGDGKADIIRRFGNYPNDGPFATEMRIHDGYLYFSSELVIYRQELTPPDLVPSSRTEVIVRDHHPVQWHNAKTLAFDDDNGLYITFSAPTNVCEDWSTTVGETSVANVRGHNPCPELVSQAGIWRFEADKPEQKQKDGKRFATGLRSVVGMEWNPADKTLYAVLHGRDYLYGHAPHLYTPWQNAVLPAEEFVKISEGDDFGWPYNYYDPMLRKRVTAPEYGGDGKQEAQGKFTDPLMGLPAHWAPNDILFYKGDQFPERYRGGAFIAFHGSTNRGPYPQAGYIVAFIPFKEGKPAGTWEVFADGFAGVDTITNMPDARFRPMGLAEGPDGSLYISESRKGRIWRVVYPGDPKQFSETQLSAMETRKSRSYIKEPDELADNLVLKKPLDPVAIYQAHCTNCHQDTGMGLPNLYPPIAANEWVSGPADRLIKVVLSGHQGEMVVKGVTYNQVMPSFGFLSDQELSEVITFIRTNFGNKGSKVTPGDIKIVRNTPKK